MCGRYTLRHIDDLQERFALTTLPDQIIPRYNAAPTQLLPVIVQRDGIRQIELMRWGLVPAWEKLPKPSYSTINARAEGIASKPVFRQSLATQRCIIPCDGFYEWVTRDGKKYPWFIHLRDDRLFGFAGLYAINTQLGGEPLQTFTIITTAANSVVAAIHPRMDVILPPDQEDAWLDPALTDARELERFYVPYPSEAMEAYPVSTLVNNVRNDRPEILHLLADEPSPLPRDDAPSQGSLF